jgi:hypothetical protein
MFSEAKRIIKYAPLTAFMLINTNFITEIAQNNPFLHSKGTYKPVNIEEKKEEKKKENINNAYLFDYINEHFFTVHKKMQQYTLIEKAINSTNIQSVDSVIKFVDKDILKNYFAQNKISTEYEHGEINLNRLRALTRTGAEIFNERLNLIKKHNNKPLSNYDRRDRSLEQLAEYLGTKPGRIETNKQNIEHFFKLYQDDIEYASRENSISRELLAGLIKHESRGFSFAISETGALGPGQTTSYIYSPNSYWPNEKKDINPFDTPQAIYRTAEHLSHLIKKYQTIDDKEHTLALSAYNQGETTINIAIRTARQDGITKPKEIINYVKENEQNELDLEKMFFLSKEGRGFSAKVQKEMENIQPYLTSYLVRN